jgi:hypothetical protein
MLSAVNASTVSVSKGLNPGFAVQSFNGTALNAFTILVGSFDANPVNPTAESLQALLQTTAFNEFGRSAAPATGLVTASITKNTFADIPATEFNSRNIYVVVMNDATAALATEFALLTLDATSPANTWVFPGDVTNALTTTNAPTGTLTNFATLVGTEIDNPNSSSQVPEFLQLAPVPEPGVTSLLLVLAGLAGARRRR